MRRLDVGVGFVGVQQPQIDFVWGVYGNLSLVVAAIGREQRHVGGGAIGIGRVGGGIETKNCGSCCGVEGKGVEQEEQTWHYQVNTSIVLP